MTLQPEYEMDPLGTIQSNPDPEAPILIQSNPRGTTDADPIQTCYVYEDSKSLQDD